MCLSPFLPVFSNAWNSLVAKIRLLVFMHLLLLLSRVFLCHLTSKISNLSFPSNTMCDPHTHTPNLTAFLCRKFRNLVQISPKHHSIFPDRYSIHNGVQQHRKIRYKTKCVTFLDLFLLLISNRGHQGPQQHKCKTFVLQSSPFTVLPLTGQ